MFNGDAMQLLQQYKKRQDEFNRLKTEGFKDEAQKQEYIEYFSIIKETFNRLYSYTGHEFAKKKTKYSHCSGRVYSVILLHYYIKRDFTPNFQTISPILKKSIGFTIASTTFTKCKAEAVIVFSNILNKVIEVRKK